MIENGSVLAEGYVPPTPDEMHLPDLFAIGSFGVGKQMLLVLLSVVIIAGFFLWAGNAPWFLPGHSS